VIKNKARIKYGKEHWVLKSFVPSYAEVGSFKRARKAPSNERIWSSHNASFWTSLPALEKQTSIPIKQTSRQRWLCSLVRAQYILSIKKSGYICM